jgi:hypothetical protein
VRVALARVAADEGGGMSGEGGERGALIKLTRKTLVRILEM